MKPIDEELMGAVAESKPESVRTALDGDADANMCEDGGYTVLMAAIVESTDMAIADMILDAGAGIDSIDEQGRTALHHAAMAGRPEAVALLLNRGAKKEIRDNDGMTPFEIATDYSAPVEILNLLKIAEKDTKISRADMTAILIMATIQGNVKEVEKMITAGADVNGKDKHGSTSLHWAADAGHILVMKTLLAGGADLTLTNNSGNTPLHLAALNSRLECMELLVKAGAPLHLQNPSGDTPLHMAIAGRASERKIIEKIARLLLDAGGDPGQVNNNRYTIRMLARAHGLDSLVLSLPRGKDESPIDKSARGIKSVEIAYKNQVRIQLHPNDQLQPLTFESGSFRDMSGMRCNAVTAWDRFRDDHVAKADALWFLPFLKRMKDGETIPFSEIWEAYQKQFTQPPNVKYF